MLSDVKERGNPRQNTEWHEIFALSSGNGSISIALASAKLDLLKEKDFDPNNEHHRKQLADLASNSLTNAYNLSQQAVEDNIAQADLNEGVREIITNVVKQHYAPKYGA